MPRSNTSSSSLQRLWTWCTGREGRKAQKRWRVRSLVQLGFLVTCLVSGVLFYRFVRAAEQGALPLPDRPAGVEAFLPISGLMGLKHWWLSGELNTIHPAATIVLLLAIATSWLLRKSFCAWICPVGWISEKLAALGRRLYGRNFRIWRWLDIPLRGLKYLLLAFFAHAIWKMSEPALAAFIHTPYNRVADIKMGLFFVELGTVGAVVLAILVVGSTFVQGTWCRYLCPYGALLGLFSWLSPVRVRRDPVSCTDCGLCDRVCMARLSVSKSKNVLDAECTGCLDCVAVCPVKDTLQVKAGPTRMPVWSFAAVVVLLFFGGYVSARVAGVWDNEITDREYVERVQNIDGPEYGHPGGNGRPASRPRGAAQRSR